MERRVFLQLPLYAASAYLASQTEAQESRFKVFPVPKSVNKPNIEMIVKTLSSGAPVSSVPDFIDLVQYVHSQLWNGMGYAQHSRAFFASHGIEQEGSFEVVTVKNFRKQEGVVSDFSHNYGSEKRNIAFIDADLNPANFLLELNEALYLGVFGPSLGKVHDIANAHRDISYMVSHFPQLIMERRSACPFTILMDRYITAARTDLDIPPTSYSPVLPYMAYLSGKRAKNQEIVIENMDMDGVVKLGTKFNLDAGDIHEQLFGGPNRKPSKQLLHKFLTTTMDYILRNNPQIDKEKLELLRQRFKEFEAIIERQPDRKKRKEEIRHG